MMLGEWLTGLPPFHTVYLHGIVRDPYGSKMSKTKGNVVDPLEVIDQLGADALRFALLYGPEPTQDQKMSTPRLEGARNFANKLWNAARFVIGSRPAEIGPDAALEPPSGPLGPAEEWILERCARTVESVDRAYANYQFGEVARTLYDAIWSEYCDWYLEMAKTGLSADSPQAARVSTWRTLSWVLDRYLRLLHPLMPFVTEEVWQRTPHLAADPELLMVAPWPDAPPESVPDERRSDDAFVPTLIRLVTAIRAARAQAGIEPGTYLDAVVYLPAEGQRRAYDTLRPVVERLARIRTAELSSVRLDDRLGPGIAVTTSDAAARLLRSDADRAKDRARLDKELRNVEGQLAAAERRVNDANFVDRAPADVVEQARKRVSELRGHVSAVRARLEET
jgi:valyl-tRNA synthetase